MGVFLSVGTNVGFFLLKLQTFFLTAVGKGDKECVARRTKCPASGAFSGSEVTFQTNRKIVRCSVKVGAAHWVRSDVSSTIFCLPERRGLICRFSPLDGAHVIDLATLAVFSGAVLLLLLSPGPNMAFVISHGVTHGWRGGMASALGIGVADLLLTVLTATGVTALVASWPPSFDLIRYAGVVYLLWLVFKTLQKSPGLHTTAVSRVPLRQVFVQAMLNSLLNPKALLFFLVFLPQFVKPEAGSIAVQLMLLGGVLTLIAAVFHALLGTFGGALSRLFARRSKGAWLQKWGLATVLMVLAVRLAVMSRPN
jgi:threonine/homoserine/homoserine lactone efflux protein